jgi:UDP:flavonoid glycosyltransferase YjiC (YdhE family)
VYNGKPIIGYPIDMDQPASCYRIELFGYGLSLQKNPTSDKIKNSIKMVVAKEKGGNKF